MASKVKQFPIKREEYLAKTHGLTMLEQGAYWSLLEYYCMAEDPMPTDLSRIYRICGAYTPQEAETVDFILGNFFVRNSVGSYDNPWADECIKKANEFSDKQRRNGSKRWAKEKSGIGLALPLACQNDAKQTTQKFIYAGARTKMLLRPSTKILKPLCDFAITRFEISKPKLPKTQTKDKASLGKPSPEFEQFWQAYPNTGRRVNKVGCYKTWVRDNLDPVIGTVLAGLEGWKLSADWADGKYVPMTATFLNQRRWETPPPDSAGQTEKDWL